jgi:hypothetical protein
VIVIRKAMTDTSALNPAAVAQHAHILVGMVFQASAPTHGHETVAMPPVAND